MEKENKRSYNEILIVSEAVKKEKSDKKEKGTGIYAALALAKEVLEFEKQVEDCIGAQDMEVNRRRIEEFNKYIESMYRTLLEIARGGIRSAAKTEQSVAPVETSKSQVGGLGGMIEAPVPPKV